MSDEGLVTILCPLEDGQRIILVTFDDRHVQARYYAEPAKIIFHDDGWMEIVQWG